MPFCRLSSLVATIVVVPLVRPGFAHSCSDGSHVTCMAVHPSPGAQAMGNRGYPFCTPEGEKVFCLVDHDNHECGPGEEPCCQDGSDPFNEAGGGRRRHGHSHGGRRMDGRRFYDVVTCTPPNDPLKGSDYVYGELGVNACPSDYTTITDAAACEVASKQLGLPYVAGNHDGANEAVCNGWACGAAHGQGSGCEDIRLSSNHGVAARWICSKPQTTGGTTARPKAVTFTLYKEDSWCNSWVSKFRTKNIWRESVGMGGESAGSDNQQSISECATAVVADTDCSQTFYAQSGVCECVRQDDVCNPHPSSVGNSIYRVGELNASDTLATAVTARTMVASTTSGSKFPLATLEATAATITTTTNTAEVDIQGAHAYKTGVLTLKARSNEGSDEDLHGTLEEHEWVMQAVIEDKLGSPQVIVLRTAVARGRRLQDPGNHVFEVQFQSRSFSISISEANTGLKSALQDAFAAANVGVIVEFASLRWTSSDVSADGQRNKDNMFSTSAIVGLALAMLLTVAACGIFARILMRKPSENVTIANKKTAENPPDEENLAGFEGDESAERFTIRNPATTFGLPHVHGEEKAEVIEIWEGRREEHWDESWEKKPEEKWEMRSSSTGEGATRSQTSSGETTSESQTNDGWTTSQGTVHTSFEGDV